MSMTTRSHAFWDHQRERSNEFMLKLMIASALFFGRTIIRIVLWPIVTYFMLTAPQAVRASRLALRHLLSRPATTMDVLRHFHCFATCTLDRLYFLKGRRRRLQVEFTRGAGVTELLQRQQGCLLLVAHIGSFEAMRAIGTSERKLPITILMDRKHGEMMLKMLERMNSDFALSIIDAAERGPALMLQLKEALSAGRIVCIMADRARVDERTLEVEFFGSNVRVLEGPWALATALRVPVLFGFGLFMGGRRYAAHVEIFSEQFAVARSERTAAMLHGAQSFATRLAHHVRQRPYNWFNFYDYWAEDAAGQNHSETA